MSCTSSTACTAVGNYYQSGSSNRVALAERWNGTSWSIQATPTLTGAAGSGLNGVACPSTTTCLAVGYSTDSAGNQHSLAERWNGTTWSTQTAPGFGQSYLKGISCTSTNACTAVSHNTNSAGVQLALVERWNGTVWSIQPSAPAPAGAYATALNAVSCTSALLCFAVGVVDYLDPTPLAERWNGTTWTITALGDGTPGTLFGVSCTSTTSCITAGATYLPPYGPTVTLVAGWDGAGWSVVTAPSPVDGQLLGVSCSSPIACTAVGGPDTGGTGAPLVERYS